MNTTPNDEIKVTANGRKVNFMRITKTTFEIIFGICMNVKLTESCTHDEDGNVKCYPISITPMMIIRDFALSYPNCDKEFTDIERAYEFFESLNGNCRVMDNAGTIYFDAF